MDVVASQSAYTDGQDVGFIQGVITTRKKPVGALMLLVQVNSDQDAALIKFIVKRDKFDEKVLSLFLIGTAVKLGGKWSEKDRCVFVETWEVLRASGAAGLRGVERLVECCQEGIISKESVARALECDADLVEKMLGGSEKERKKLLVHANRRLKGLKEDRTRTRKPVIRNEEWEKISEAKQSLPELFPLELIQLPETAVVPFKDVESRYERNKRLKRGEQVVLSKEELDTVEKVSNDFGLQFNPLEALQHSDRADSSYVNYCCGRKIPQVRWMMDRLKELCCDDEKFVIFDIGCGKGDLTLNIAATFPGITVVGLDVNEDSLVIGRGRASERNVTNVKFVHESVETLMNQSREQVLSLSGSSSPVEQLNIVYVGLHACGGLSDLICLLALRHCASVLCVTCCFHRHNNFRNALQEGGNDGNHDYFWGLTVEVGKTLCRICELHGRNEYNEAMQIVNSFRLCWLKDKVGNDDEKNDFKLLCFPSQYSMKNQVLYVQRRKQ